MARLCPLIHQHLVTQKSVDLLVVLYIVYILKCNLRSSILYILLYYSRSLLSVDAREKLHRPVSASSAFSGPRRTISNLRPQSAGAPRNKYEIFYLMFGPIP